MRLSCPQCHTEYEVPDAALAGRARTLRCADCGTKFKAPELTVAEAPAPEEILSDTIAIPSVASEIEFDITPEEVDHAMIETALPDVVAAAPAFEPEVSLSASRATPVLPRPAPETPNRALGISLLILVVIIAVILAEHKAISLAWPPSQRLFNALGLH